MTVHYPQGEVTPHGWWHLINDTRPMMGLIAYDGSIQFDLLGGMAAPYNDPATPEAVVVVSLDGLIAPWTHIDQKGATQDGITQVDSLLDPIEVEMVVECIGRDNKHVRRVFRDLVASLDAIRESELWFFTPELGYWWAPIRWYKGAPKAPLANPQIRRQRIPLRLRADDGCWRTFDDTDQFRFIYDSVVDTFDTDHAEDAGADWPVYFYEEGTDAAGHPRTLDGSLVWSESGVTERAAVLGPFAGFDSDTDNQFIEIELGDIPDLFYRPGAFNDIFGRMGATAGDWDGNGVRARIGMDGWWGWVELARYNDFVKTVMHTERMFLRPQRGEKYALVCGSDGDPRLFRILRNGLPVLSHKETGTGSALGADYRGVGVGLKAGPNTSAFGTPSQRSPAYVTRISAGDNAAVTQSGFLKRTNVGDLPMYDDYTLFGPGTFRLYDGPGSDEYVEFGPLLADQIVFLRTDPRTRTSLVEDMTVAPRTPQQLSVFQEALNKLLDFAGLNGSKFSDQFAGLFGKKVPQGNLYRFLSGRFSDNAAIPPKSPGSPATPYHVKVQIVDGNADSKIVVSGVPLRRWPL